MNCEQIQDWLADYLGDELPDDDRRCFDQHLSLCSACRQEVEALRSALSALRCLPPPNGAGYTQSVPVPPRRAGGLLACAAMLLIGIGIGYAAGIMTPTPPQPEMDGNMAASTPGNVHPAWVQEWSGTGSADPDRRLARNLALFTRSMSAPGSG